MTWVGALTALVAATTGLLRNDIKGVIAYSTMSQMEVMATKKPSVAKKGMIKLS